LELRSFEGSAVAVMDSVDLAGGVGQRVAGTAPDDLQAFRSGWYGALRRRADALFELGDAVLCCEGAVTCPPRLSLTPVFRRGWGSVYAALARGRIDEDALRDLLVAHRPAHWPLVFAVDASTWARCDAETSPDRGFYYHPSRHSAGQPIVAGWSYQWIAQLGWEKNSWTAPLDVRRLHPREDTVAVTAAQVTALVTRLGRTAAVPLFVFDAGYDPIALTVALAGVRAQLLVRIRGDRVFYREPPARPAGALGRPRRHGTRFACADPGTWGAPDDELTVTDDQYGRVQVFPWSGLHPKLGGRGRWAGHDEPPIVAGTVIRVQVEHLPKPTARAVKTLWLWWAGLGEADLSVCWRAYLRRFDLEHTFRFAKNTLGWTTPRVATPDQGDRWTWLVMCALTQLRLARGLVADARLPWERRLDPTRLTPARARRGFRGLRNTLGTPAAPAKPSHPGPGCPKGARSGPHPRHPAIKKAA
jgi:hypothetical protein